MVKELDVNDHDAVFAVFDECAAELGGLDRVIVNAGLGKGRADRQGLLRGQPADRDDQCIGALAQCEAAMQEFRAANAGHLVVMSSVSARRGCRGPMTTTPPASPAQPRWPKASAPT